MCDIINICSYYVLCDYSLKVEVGSLVGVGFIRSLKMQLLLWCTLIDWLGIFCTVRIMFGGGVVSRSQYCSLSLPIPCMKRNTSCIVRKGEKQIQILDGY
jgi:hypothetical protein